MKQGRCQVEISLANRIMTLCCATHSEFCLFFGLHNFSLGPLLEVLVLTKILALGVFSFMIASVSQAHQIVCEGNYAVYHFHFQASLNSTDTRIRGPISVVITGAGQTRTGSLTPTNSDIVTEHHMRAAGTSAEGSGSLDANYDSGSGMYTGTLNAVSPERNVNVNVRCGIYLD